MHILCTICSDLVNQAENIFVTNCGHIFHHHCLVQWIERSKSCPQCRHKVTENCMFRLFPTISNETSGDDAATLQSRLDDVQLQLRQQKATCKEKEDKLSMLNTDLKRNEDLLKSYEKKLVSRDSAVSALKEQLEYVKMQNKEVNKLKEDNEVLRKNLQTLSGLQKVINATSDDVENILKGYPDVKSMAIFATALKRALTETEAKKNESRDRLHASKQQLGMEKKNVADLQAKLVQLEDRLANTERKLKALETKRRASEESTEDTVPKVPRNSDVIDLNTAILTDSTNSSFNSMVQRIESANSPYLTLKQSCMALAALNRHRVTNNSPEKRKTFLPENFWKPNARFDAFQKAVDSGNLSIFHKNQPVTHDLCDDLNLSQMDVSYDGLGGHSKLDIFPVPKQRPTLKNLAPKLSAKHKLKRPSAPAGSQDIGKLLENMKQQYS